MKDPRDCVPKGTVPLMSNPEIARQGSYHEYNGFLVNGGNVLCWCAYRPKCTHVGFRVPPEMVSTFKHERSPTK